MDSGQTVNSSEFKPSASQKHLAWKSHRGPREAAAEGFGGEGFWKWLHGFLQREPSQFSQQLGVSRFEASKKETKNKLTNKQKKNYRYGVELCRVFALLFILPSVTAAVQRFGGVVLPNAHRCVSTLLVSLRSSRPSSVDVGCNHCRRILQSGYIVQGSLTYTRPHIWKAHKQNVEINLRISTRVWKHWAGWQAGTGRLYREPERLSSLISSRLQTWLVWGFYAAFCALLVRQPEL